MTSPPDTPSGGFAGTIDRGIYRVEQAFVTLAALVMTATVFLDIVYRAFATPESQLARKLTTFVSWFGVEKSEATYEALRDYGTPTILILVTFGCGWAVYGAAQRRKGEPSSAALGVVWGVVAVGAAYGFIQLVLGLSSRWMCTLLLVGGAVAYFADAARRKDNLGMVLAVLMAGLGAWGCTLLPPQYIWSQELSLILLAWVAFIGASMATREIKHIQVDALSKVVPKALRPWTRALGLLAATLFCLYMTYLAYEHVFGPKGDFRSGEVRPATRLPAWLIIFSAVVAFALMSLRFGAQALHAFLHPTVPERELTH